MSNCGERKFFNDSHQSSKTRAHYPQDFKSYLRMCQAELLKRLFADEKQSCVTDRRRRCRVGPPVKDWELCYRTAGTINAQHLLPSAGGGFEDPHMPCRYDVEPCAWVALMKDALARAVGPRDGVLGEEIHLCGSKAGENRDF